jgi:hypothetical protein
VRIYSLPDQHLPASSRLLIIALAETKIHKAPKQMRFTSETAKHISSRFRKHLIALACCLAIAVYYFAQSDPFDAGFYQQDEVGHFLQIIHFWKDPLTILTDMWARGGFKILYAVPGLAGWTGVVATNIFFAVGSAFLAYLLALKYKMPNAWMVIPFTALQPLMATLGFRCYPELPATFFITLLLYVYQNKRYVSAALIASFLFTIRQELAVVAVLLGVIFVFKKQWIPLLCLLAAPLVMTVLGIIKHHDPLYVVHMMVEGGLKEEYRRNGFFYLWVMLPDVTGIVIFYLLVVSAFAFVIYRHKKQVLIKYHMPLLVTVVYFLMHCIFTSTMFGFGRSGGATRFLLPILPVVALFALGGLNYLLYAPLRRTRLIVATVALLPAMLMIIFIDYFRQFSFFGFNALSFTEINSQLLAITFLLTLACIIWPLTGRKIVYAIPAIALLYCLKCVVPIPLSNEDLVAEAAADWLYNANANMDRLYSNHTMFTYYYGLKKGSYDALSYDSTIFSKVRDNDVIVYDTHYGTKIVNHQMFNQNRDRYHIIKQFNGELLFKIFLIQTKTTH